MHDAMLAGRSLTRGETAARLAEIVVAAEEDRLAAWTALTSACREAGIDPQTLVDDARRRVDPDRR